MMVKKRYNFNAINLNDYDKFFYNQKLCIDAYEQFIMALRNKKYVYINYLGLNSNDFDLEFDLKNEYTELCMDDTDCEIIVHLPVKIYLDGKDISKDEYMFLYIVNGIAKDFTISQ